MKRLLLLLLPFVFLTACTGGGNVSCRVIVISYITTYHEECFATKYGEDCSEYPLITPVYDCVPIDTPTPGVAR